MSALLFPQIFSALDSESVFFESLILEVNSEEFVLGIENVKGLLAGTNCYLNIVVSPMELNCTDFPTTLIF